MSLFQRAGEARNEETLKRLISVTYIIYHDILRFQSRDFFFEITAFSNMIVNNFKCHYHVHLHR